MEQEIRKGVVVYCASSSKISDVYFRAARTLGEELGRAGIPLINGAGNLGLMGATIDGVLAAGGHCIGVIPRFMADKGWAHPGINDLRVVDTMHARKAMMAELSCGAVVLPGGIGTLDEMCEIITWRQLKLYNNPVVLLNIAGYWNPFLEMLAKADSEGFMRATDRPLFHVADTPEEALSIILKDAL